MDVAPNLIFGFSVIRGPDPRIHPSSRKPFPKGMDCRVEDRRPAMTSRVKHEANQKHPLMTHHHLHSSPATCHWGFFEAKLKPVLTVASGDEVTIDTISGGPEMVPDRDRFHVPSELFEIHSRNERMVPGHILTGPVAIEGALPGDVLE